MAAINVYFAFIFLFFSFLYDNGNAVRCKKNKKKENWLANDLFW